MDTIQWVRETEEGRAALKQDPFIIEKKRKVEMRMAEDQHSYGTWIRNVGDFIIEKLSRSPLEEISIIQEPEILLGAPFDINGIPNVISYIQRELINTKMMLVVYPVIEFKDQYVGTLMDVKMRIVPI